VAKVCLHGSLAEQFGPEYVLDIANAAEVFRALDANLRGFGLAVRQGSYRIVRGDLNDGIDLDIETLRLGVGHSTKLHIIPEVAGAKGKKGGAKAIIGIAIMAVAIVAAPPAGAGGMAEAASDIAIFGEAITYGTVAKFGFSMALSGIAQMLSPQAKAPGSFESADKRASFIFNGAINSQEQGGAVPIIYGRMRVGSSVISGALNIEQMTAPTDSGSTTASAPTVANVSGVRADEFTEIVVITKGATVASYMKFTSINDGSLYREDKITQINNDDKLSLADLGKGVVFKPKTNSGGSFTIQQLTSDLTTVGDTTTATIPPYVFDAL
jgi:predicted phage tail protein